MGWGEGDKSSSAPSIKTLNQSFCYNPYFFIEILPEVFHFNHRLRDVAAKRKNKCKRSRLAAHCLGFSRSLTGKLSCHSL